MAVQGLGGLGHPGVQFANRFGFRTVAVSRGKDKERLARDLGADEYLDTEASDPVQELLRMGGARVVLATAPSDKAIASKFMNDDNKPFRNDEAFRWSIRKRARQAEPKIRCIVLAN